MNVKYFLALVLIFVSFTACITKEKEPKKTDVKIEDGVEVEPNIFVAKTTFPSKDGILISADLYEVNGKKPTILLCHQAGYSRGEYKDTAIELNKFGYSCMAIDQRSGNKVNGIVNETAKRAKMKGLETTFLDTEIDIEAAINYLYEMNGNQPILLVGSSYSASLSLFIGKNNPKVKAIAAFSPGEYLGHVKLKNRLSDLKKPVYVTSSKEEIKDVDSLNLGVKESFLLRYRPQFEGVHGSRALWSSTEGNEKYWDTFKAFIDEVFFIPPVKENTEE